MVYYDQNDSYSSTRMCYGCVRCSVMLQWGTERPYPNAEITKQAQFHDFHHTRPAVAGYLGVTSDGRTAGLKL